MLDNGNNMQKCAGEIIQRWLKFNESLDSYCLKLDFDTNGLDEESDLSVVGPTVPSSRSDDTVTSAQPCEFYLSR